MGKTKKPAGTGTFVCGRPVEEIRRAYFDGELGKMCAAIMAEGKVGTEGMTALAALLDELKKEEADFKTELEKKAGGGIFPTHIKPPTVDELMGKEEYADAKPLDERAGKVRLWVDETLDRIVKSMTAGGEKLKPSFWLDTGVMAIRARAVSADDMAVKGLYYHATLTRIIDEHGCSRREAEDRARLTPEYLKYKLAQNLTETLDRLEMMMKKFDARDGGRF